MVLDRLFSARCLSRSIPPPWQVASAKQEAKAREEALKQLQEGVRAVEGRLQIKDKLCATLSEKVRGSAFQTFVRRAFCFCTGFGLQHCERSRSVR